MAVQWTRISAFVVVCAGVLLALPAAAQSRPDWPTVEQQLATDRVQPGSALEQLIHNHQDFTVLHPKELGDGLRYPLWLRVLWRKNHPEFVYQPDDPTGGYPLVLKEIAEWMRTHQDLLPGATEQDVPPGLRATIGANVRISGAQTSDRSESDIRINFNNTNQIIAGSNNIGGSGQQGQYYSLDGGVNWGQTTLPLQTGLGDSFHSDPTVDWTSDGTAWATTIGINGSATVLQMRSYRSSNFGQTWTFDATFSGSQTSADKQIMWVDHSASSPFRDRIYVCWHNGLPGFINRRTGPAGSWQTPIQVTGAESTGTAIGCDIKTNANGDVFTWWPTTGNQRIFVKKSTDGGATWGAAVQIATTADTFEIGVPSFNGRKMLIYVTGGAYRTATKNLAYAAWNDLSKDTGCTAPANEPGANTASTCKSRIWFSRSTDGGATWSAPVKINNQAGLNDQFNPWLAVDEARGRIGIIYYDTVADPGRRKTHVYYQTSSDDGASWSAAQQVTTAQTDETIAGADAGNQYGDYNSLSAAGNLLFPSWTDRRNNGNEEIWTARLDEAGGPCVPPAAPAGLTATAVSSSQINLSWSAVGGASSYNVYRSTTTGGPYAAVGSSAGTTFSSTGLAPSTTYFFVVRAVAGCESGNSNEASATTLTAPACTTTTLYSRNFDAATGLDGFALGTFVAGGSTTSWRGVQTCTAASGTRIFRYGGTGCTTNYGNNNFNFAQPNGSGGITIPAGATTGRLTFKHRRAFENGFDGGTLAVSTDGANYTFVPASAILGGSYNGTVAASCPPAGAAGASIWTGLASAFTTTTVDLDAACNAIAGNVGGCAGKAVRIAFIAITDCSLTDDGWFLDDVTVSACVP